MQLKQENGLMNVSLISVLFLFKYLLKCNYATVSDMMGKDSLSMTELPAGKTGNTG